MKIRKGRVALFIVIVPILYIGAKIFVEAAKLLPEARYEDGGCSC